MRIASSLSLAPLILLTTLNACKGQQNKPKKTAKRNINTTQTGQSIRNTWKRGCNGGYDCIRSIDKPDFISIKEVDFIGDDDLVVGLKIGDEVRCYPHAILDWHEIVNDHIGKTDFAINYCPLTGSAMAWDRHVDGMLTDFGVRLVVQQQRHSLRSGNRFHWSQMKQEYV